MGVPRRTVLGGVAVVLAGCSGTSTDGETATDGQTTPTDGGQATTDPTTTATPDAGAGCDPNDVTRPPVADDTGVGGQEYPSPPDSPSAQSLMEFLADFETAFAWNRAVGSRENVTSINVDTLDGFTPEAAGDGFLASSAMRVMFATGQGGDETETGRFDYVASYYVGPSGVYRVETADSRIDPRDSAERQLVACGGAQA